MEYCVATQISVIAEFIKFISDNGVMLVISAVVIYFMIKVLNSMLNQNEKMVNQIIPQLQELKKTILDIIIKINEADSRRTVIQNKQLSETREKEHSMMNSINDIKQQLEELNETISKVEDELEHLNMHLNFKQSKKEE